MPNRLNVKVTPATVFLIFISNQKKILSTRWHLVYQLYLARLRLTLSQPHIEREHKPTSKIYTQISSFCKREGGEQLLVHFCFKHQSIPWAFFYSQSLCTSYLLNFFSLLLPLMQVVRPCCWCLWGFSCNCIICSLGREVQATDKNLHK